MTNRSQVGYTSVLGMNHESALHLEDITVTDRHKTNKIHSTLNVIDSQAYPSISFNAEQYVCSHPSRTFDHLGLERSVVESRLSGSP